MLSFPRTEKQLKSRITSYNSVMKKEKKVHDFIIDSGGKRYLLFSFYFVLNDLEKSKKYFDWYEEEFSDDVGEPIQKLCWALSLFRMQNLKAAKKKLADLMFSNLYIIPFLLNEEIEEYNIWHFSNHEHLEYVEYLPEEVIQNISKEELGWIKDLYNSFEFTRLRKKYLEIYSKLKSTKGPSERRTLINQTDSLLTEIGSLDE